MTKLTNVRERIHVTMKVRTPFRGTLRDLMPPRPNPSSFLIMLLAVPPAPHLDGETLRIIVNDKVQGEHTLGWLMKFWDIGQQRAERGSHADVLQNACDVATVICRRALAQWDEYSRPEATAELQSIANAMRQLAEAAGKLQLFVCGMRLGRAIAVPSDHNLEIITRSGSEVDCHIGGLATFDA